MGTYRLYYDIVGTICVPVVVAHKDHFAFCDEFCDFYLEVTDEEAEIERNLVNSLLY